MAAFDRGTTAYLGEDFASAARWFEMANDLAPAAPALLQAIRAHRRAGNPLRAATLSLRLIHRFPEAEAEVTEAQSVIDALGEQFVRVEVTCDGECAVDLDGTLVGTPSFFLDPGTEHRVSAAFDTGQAEAQTVTGSPGQTETLHFVAPEPSFDAPPQGGEDDNPVITVGSGSGSSAGSGSDSTDDDGGGLGPGLFVTTLGLTVVSGVILAWSGVDTLNAADEYEQVAAEERAAGQLDFPRASQMLEDGQSKETRTNALIGVTAGLAALTLVFAIVTDWGGSDDDADARVRPSGGVLAGDQRGGVLGLEGAF